MSYRIMTGIIPPHARHIAVAVLALATLDACARSTRGAPPASQISTSSATPAATPAPIAAQGEAAAIARARADSVRYPYIGADVHFMSSMIGHHAQAIVMSHMAPSHGASPAVLRLASRIINSQQDEIATMQRWLSERRQRVPEAKAGPMPMMMDGMEHDMMMPGMLTAAQMMQLGQAKGAEFDRRFLTFMIQHHRGAVSMVRDLFQTPGAAQDETVFKFANDVNVDQTTEIARMETLLATLVFGQHSQ